MSEHSIFGDAGGAGRGDRPSDDGHRRPTPCHGLFGARLLRGDRKTGTDDGDEGELPLSRN